MRVLDLPSSPKRRRCIGVTSTTVAPSRALGDELLEVALERRECADTITFFPHVIVAELDVEVIARLDLSEDLVQPLCARKERSELAGLRVIRHRDAALEEPRQHLPPRGPRLVVLVCHRRVAGEEDGDRVHALSDADGLHTGALAVQFERELIVPSQRRFSRPFNLTRSLPPAICGVRTFTVNVRVTNSPGLVSTALEHELPRLGLTVFDVAREGSPKRDRDVVVALGQRNRKRRRRFAGLDSTVSPAPDANWALSAAAYVCVGVTGSGRCGTVDEVRHQADVLQPTDAFEPPSRRCAAAHPLRFVCVLSGAKYFAFASSGFIVA